MGTPTWRDRLSSSLQTRKLMAQRIVLKRFSGVSEDEVKSLSLRDFSVLWRKLAWDVHALPDLTQNPMHVFTTSGALPCILTKFCVYSLVLDRPLLSEEALLSHGIDLLGIGNFHPPWGTEFHTMPDTAKQDLIGNSINVHVAACVFALSFSELLPRVVHLQHHLNPVTPPTSKSAAESAYEPVEQGVTKKARST
jgi:hypothetical protein